MLPFIHSSSFRVLHCYQIVPIQWSTILRPNGFRAATSAFLALTVPHLQRWDSVWTSGQRWKISESAYFHLLIRCGQRDIPHRIRLRYFQKAKALSIPSRFFRWGWFRIRGVASVCSNVLSRLAVGFSTDPLIEVSCFSPIHEHLLTGIRRQEICANLELVPRYS